MRDRRASHIVIAATSWYRNVDFLLYDKPTNKLNLPSIITYYSPLASKKAAHSEHYSQKVAHNKADFRVQSIDGEHTIFGFEHQGKLDV